ncbi:hypothetical protein BRL75_02820, partial [Xanthomonas oryzae pv. oryzae]
MQGGWCGRQRTDEQDADEFGTQDSSHARSGHWAHRLQQRHGGAFAWGEWWFVVASKHGATPV